MSTSLTLYQATPAELPATVPAPVRAAALLLAAGEPVSTLTTDELGDKLVAAIPGIAFLLGHSRQFIKQEDIDAMAEAVAELIHRRFARLNWAEISCALRRGASGEWPRSAEDVLLVSLPHITHWLACYCREARAEAQLALQTLPTLPPPPPPPRDLVAEVVALAAQAQAKQLPAGFELDFGNVLYDWLKGLGAFRPFRTNAQLLDMRAEEAAKELARAKPEQGGPARLEHGTFLKALGAGEFPADHPLSRSVLNACKKRLLREWLRHHAEAGTDLAQLLAELQQAALPLSQAA